MRPGQAGVCRVPGPSGHSVCIAWTLPRWPSPPTATTLRLPLASSCPGPWSWPAQLGRGSRGVSVDRALLLGDKLQACMQGLQAGTTHARQGRAKKTPEAAVCGLGEPLSSQRLCSQETDTGAEPGQREHRENQGRRLWRERHSESGRQREGSRHILAAAGALGPWDLPAHQEGGLVVSLTVSPSLQLSSLYSSAVGAGVPGPPGPPRLCHLPWPLKPQEGQQDPSPGHPSLLNAMGLLSAMGPARPWRQHAPPRPTAEPEPEGWGRSS